MFVKSYASALIGIEALTVSVEVNITQGIGMYMVGLPDNAVRESQERIRAAFGNCSYRMSGKKIVVNLAPADIRKEGSAYDLPIAIAILAASEQLSDERIADFVIMGELSLDGSVLPVRGALPIALEAKKQGFRGVILPAHNAAEAAVVDGLEVYGCDAPARGGGFSAGRKRVDTGSDRSGNGCFARSLKFLTAILRMCGERSGPKGRWKSLLPADTTC